MSGAFNGKPRPGFSDWPWLAAFCFRALWELARARIAFARFEVKHIQRRNADTARVPRAAGNGASERTLSRIAYVIPRISDRLPWRSDCLIQAMAAQSWLRALGSASTIRLGVENPKDGEFGAHAWLICDDRIITGGDIERYDTILSE
jgi:hypothetical protein